ncbi:MAG TPA: GAF domain-containing protein [Solirubrobacterales bacterium]|nr:GAF domain-containing protein [Solirubrobacterales bacterium]
MAASARPDQQLFVLAQRLAGRTGATGVILLEARCGRVQVRDLLKKQAIAEPARPEDLELHEAARRTPRTVGNSVVVSVPTTPAEDQMRGFKSAVLILSFGDGAEFPLTGRRSWAGLRVLGNLVQSLLEAEHSFRFNNRLRQFHRRSVRQRRSGDVAYLALHAIRDVMAFDGHCGLLLWEPADEVLEVIAHVSGDRPAGAKLPPEAPTFAMNWRGSHASLLLGQAAQRSCFVASRSAGQWKAGVRQLEEIGMGSEPKLSTPPEGIQYAIDRLLESLSGAELVRGSSALILPLQQGGHPLGLLVISATSENAFSTGEIEDAWELSLLCISPLARVSRLLGDFRLSESVLERTSALQPDVPLEENRPLTATLSLLCDRLLSDIGADAVALIPYAYKRGELVSRGIASAGLDLGLEKCTLRSGGVVEQVLGATEPIEWGGSAVSQPPELAGFSRLFGIDRVFGAPLRAPDGNPLGVVFVAWRAADEGAEGRQHRKEISRLDRKRTDEFSRVAEAYLAQHESWFGELKSQRLLSGVYTDLLQSIGTTSEDPVEFDFSAARRRILGRLLETALDLVGGTAGLFAMPSGDHAGLDVVTSRGHGEGFDGSRIPFGLGVTGRCAEIKELTVISDTADRDGWPAGVEPHKTIEGVKCEVAFPVTDGSVHDLLLGVFDLENQRVARGYGKRDEEQTRRIAQAASIAIGLTRQFEQTQSIARLGRMIDNAIRDSEEEVFRVALEEAARVTGAFAASARVGDRSGTRLLPMHHYGDPGDFSQSPLSAMTGANGAAFRTGRVVCVGDTWLPETYPEIQGFKYLRSRSETRSECSVPIHWRGQRIGSCNFEHRQPFALTPYRLYLETVGAQIAQALRQRRAQSRARLDQGIELVEALSALYMNVNHSIASSFTTIETEIATLEQNGGSRMRGDTRDAVARIRSTAEEGTEKAAALLRGATGELDRPVVVTIRTLLDALRTKVREVHGEGVRLEIDSGQSEYRVIAREAMLGWILQEVVLNSYEHGGADVGVWVSVEENETSGVVAIVIDDDGYGVEQERIDRLYEVRSDERSEGGHSGLGLVAAELYIRTMRGRISSSKSPKGGLRTKLVLPWDRRSDPDAVGSARDVAGEV